MRPVVGYQDGKLVFGLAYGTPKAHEDMNTIYDGTIDNKTYRLTVKRTEPYKGRMIVSVEESGKILLDKEVVLSYDALLGPDVADLDAWQTEAIEVIDKHIEENR